jgi:hypothetical protein
MMHAYRTHNCGQLRSTNVGDEVKLSGWVHRKRDHGGVLFVDLRDHYGITQVVADVIPPLCRSSTGSAWNRWSRSRGGEGALSSRREPAARHR